MLSGKNVLLNLGVKGGYFIITYTKPLPSKLVT